MHLKSQSFGIAFFVTFFQLASRVQNSVAWNSGKVTYQMCSVCFAHIQSNLNTYIDTEEDKPAHEAASPGSG